MTAGFSEGALLVSTPDGRNFTLMSPFTYTTKAGEVITVPAGTESDGASTPRIGWNLLPPFGTYWMAAFLHDYLYRETEKAKADCDDIFYEAMDALGTDDEEARLIYEGVSLGGWAAFQADRKAEAEAPTKVTLTPPDGMSGTPVEVVPTPDDVKETPK
jgi:hypothetical protein